MNEKKCLPKTEKREKRTERLSKVRLTLTEKILLQEDFKRSFLPTFSDFVRHKLMAKNISEAHQKKFEALIQVGNLSGQLGAIGNNVNQIARRLNTFDDAIIDESDRRILRVLVKQLELIRTALNNIK